MFDINGDIAYTKSVGTKRSELLGKLNIFTPKDMLMHFPRAYENRTNEAKIADFIPQESYIFTASVISAVRVRRIRKNLSVLYFYVGDETGDIQITIFNQAYRESLIKEGNAYAFYGKVECVNEHYEIKNPIIVDKYKVDSLKGIFAKYSLTQGITNAQLRQIVSNIYLNKPQFEEIYTAEFLKQNNLVEINEAIKKIHMPQSYNDIEEARKRHIFDELFLLQLALLTIREKNMVENKDIFYKDTTYNEFLELLPFELTNAQKKAILEIISDMKRCKPMNRLVQGDVGSGKTIVAAISMYIAVKNGYQACIMAPTTILANQHFEELKKYYEKLGVTVGLLTGNTTKKEKNKILEQLKNGEIQVMIGTHSLLEDNVEFKNISLIVTDEQHRFGVKQRMKLTNKGKNIDCVVMTATPIPRSLALMLYSDLDMSIIDELPLGRKPVKTFVIDSSYKERMYGFMKKQMDEKRQIYVVCPLIEENEQLDLEAAENIYEQYKQDIFSNYSVGFIHGKMKKKEKDETMQNFVSGKIQMLVSTTVIEVGVNVKNATLMVIHNADRFGLAALHQLRGRVGRSDIESYCMLLSDNKGVNVRQRLEIMSKSNNGYEIASKDLELRGPGDYFGFRQHGLPEFKLADLMNDMSILKESANVARNLIKQDPHFENKENAGIKKAMYEKFAEQLKNIGT